MHETAVQWIKSQEKIFLVAHVSPDGDTLGSCLALYLALVSLGKSAQVLSEDPVPQAYRFLPGAADIKRPEEMNEENVPAVIAVDCADRLRMGTAESLFARAKTTLNIDHHGTNTAFAEVNDVRRAGATGELIYEIIRLLNVPVTEDMAVCLYTALATDTGNFSYSNTTPNTFRIMSELLETGFPLPEINRMLFRSTPLRKLKLQARALDKLELYCGGRVAISALSLSDFRTAARRQRITRAWSICCATSIPSRRRPLSAPARMGRSASVSAETLCRRQPRGCRTSRRRT